MFNRTRSFGRPQPATIISFLALFVALSGVSYAAVKLPKNSVGTTQIKKNGVTASDIKKNSITGDKVKDQSLTGADINASSLGTVATATNAENATNAANATTAASVNGVTIKRISYHAASGAAGSIFYEEGGLQLTGSCNVSGETSIFAKTTIAHSMLYSAISRPPNLTTVAEDSFFEPGTTIDLGTAGTAKIGSIVFTVPDGTTTAISFLSKATSGALGSTDRCFFRGTVIRA